MAEELVVFGKIGQRNALLIDEHVALRLGVFPTHQLGLLEVKLSFLQQRSGQGGGIIGLFEVGLERAERSKGFFDVQGRVLG
jgi:hypothetical protein